jgi:hypothetical protein
MMSGNRNAEDEILTMNVSSFRLYRMNESMWLFFKERNFLSYQDFRYLRE